jgi:hypothetical protein
MMLTSWQFSISQIQKDTMALIKIYNSELIDKNKIKFDLLIERNAERWLKFANGTFTLTFADTSKFKIRPENIDSIYQLRTQLKQDIVSGNMLPTLGYRTDFQVYDGRISITILGPVEFDDCDSVSLHKPLLLGTFVIKTSEPEFPDDRFEWSRPYKFYQAAAFKIENDSLYNNEILLNYSDDNLSMEDSTSITYVFINDTTRKEHRHEFFVANYIGALTGEYYWQSLKEYNIKGYTVDLGIKLDGIDDIQIVEQLGTWRPGEKYNANFVVNTNSDTSKYYGVFNNDLEYRGGTYAYILSATLINRDGTLFDRSLDTAFIITPRSIISGADAAPNPFSESTRITFTLDDDVYLTAFVTDLLGKQLKIINDTEPGGLGLIDNKLMAKGTYQFIFRAPDLASQGFYNIRFVAQPIKDPTLEESRADVKLQLVK